MTRTAPAILIVLLKLLVAALAVAFVTAGSATAMTAPVHGKCTKLMLSKAQTPDLSATIENARSGEVQPNPPECYEATKAQPPSDSIPWMGAPDLSTPLTLSSGKASAYVPILLPPPRRYT